MGQAGRVSSASTLLDSLWCKQIEWGRCVFFRGLDDLMLATADDQVHLCDTLTEHHKTKFHGFLSANTRDNRENTKRVLKKKRRFNLAY